MKLQLSIIVLILFFIGNSTYSQVLIGEPDGNPEIANGAILELRSTNSGLVLPKVVITDVEDIGPITASDPTEGILVYNTGADGVVAGFYYWSGSKWHHLSNENSVITQNQITDLYETAELYEDNGFTAPSNYIMSQANMYYGWTSAQEGANYGETYCVTNDPTASCIVAGEDGLYEIDVTVSFGGSNNVQVTGCVFHSEYVSPGVWSAGVATKTKYLVKLKANGDLEGSTAHGLIMLQEGDKIDLRFSTTSAGETLSLYNVSFIANKVGQYSAP